MAYFVIAGKPDCPSFLHVVHVARYLQERLPNFSAHIIQKQPGEWESWLEDVNWKNQWYHSTSPIIWKELSMRGGIAHYIGGISEFWEYCYDYYGMQSVISPEDLQKIVEDNLQYIKHVEKMEEKIKKDVQYVGIIGMNHDLLPLVLTELLQIEDLRRPGGIIFTLYDTEEIYGESFEYITELFEDIEPLTPTGNTDMFRVVDAMRDVVKDADLIIVLGDYSRRTHEIEIDWLVRNMSSMFMLADVVNTFAKRSLKIILAIDGPVCFNANVLIDTCTTIRIQNIVAVTSHAGLGPLQKTAEQVNLPLSSLGAPPVWGYLGINQFVDVESVIVCCDIYRPYQRVIRNKGGSTLPLGEIEAELRYVAYLITDLEEIESKSQITRKIVRDRLHHRPFLSKVRALTSLIKIWYSKEQSDDIISLGICSNGAHNIPPGFVFSQPAILDNNLWVPVKDFPVTPKAKTEIANLIPRALEVAEKMSVGPNRSNTSLYSLMS